MLPALSKPATGTGGGKSVEEALNLLGQGFLRGGLGSSFLKSAAGGSASPSPELRVGVSQAYVAAFTWLGPAWTERHLHAALTHVLDLAGGSSRSAASHTELVYTREVFVWIQGGSFWGSYLSESFPLEPTLPLERLNLRIKRDHEGNGKWGSSRSALYKQIFFFY